MTGTTKNSVTVNGRVRQISATPQMPLLWALRQELGISGPKFGCGAGLCGSCTVHVDGVAQRSCQLPIESVGSSKVTTIEGLQDDPLFGNLRKAWLDIDVMQCGYCQSGQLLSAHELLRSNPSPSSTDVDAAMEGIICRCGTYPRIRQAILTAAGGAK